MPLQVRTITAQEHRAYVAARPSVPLAQTPGWGKGFVAARTESVGWFDGDTLVGAGLFRYRGLPRLPMRSVAVFELGPDIDWTGRRRPAYSLGAWLDPLVDHLRDRGVFTVRVTPTITAREWWGFDPRQVAAGRDLVLHPGDRRLPDCRTATDRLRAASWRPWSTATPTFLAAVSLGRRQDPPDPGSSDALETGHRVRVGTIDDLGAVREAVAAAHEHVSLPSAKELDTRWRGLASDDLAGVSLLVLERDDEIVYGGLMAVVGDRAWDLSVPLPVPDADRPVVQSLRAAMMRRGRDVGATSLAVPTVTPHRRAPVRSPAPGWPPVHLSELMGTWHFPVRATWHSVLAPVVDRFVL